MSCWYAELSLSYPHCRSKNLYSCIRFWRYFTISLTICIKNYIYYLENRRSWTFLNMGFSYSQYCATGMINTTQSKNQLHQSSQECIKMHQYGAKWYHWAREWPTKLFAHFFRVFCASPITSLNMEKWNLVVQKVYEPCDMSPILVQQFLYRWIIVEKFPL